MICGFCGDHFENVGKQPLQQSGKYRVNENDEENFVRVPVAIRRAITMRTQEKNLSARHHRACPGDPRLISWICLETWMPGTRPGMTFVKVIADRLTPG
jgi:hypothetical protein